ncbi:DUF2953 domain-containing protein [Oceanobacillus sp. J11TS1]|uniref:DUF2953 domain-containing protein n=1 Tax=Oceanobacillus sp. J11TS1 TaxID=2807191 RepID=UPI001B1F77A4|nr:DUF2953 domain-containing protein [Oceanobacillus sp. J11TS1]GIO22500.1 hypothetical protein J11TS1_10810 [Oceanobacillus sp. J11TS1]
MDSLYIVLIIITVIIFIIVLLYQSKWSIKVNYRFPEMRGVQVSVYFYKWCVLRRMHSFPANHKGTEIEFMTFHKRLPLKQLHLLKDIRFQPLLKEIKLLEFNWLTKGGTGNAFTTSVASGTIWAMKGWLIGYLAQRLKLCKNPQIDVQPDFERTSLETSFSCMISFRLGKTILGIMHVLK